MFEQLSIFDMINPQCESRFTSECRKGSGFENGKIRIYCASLHLGMKEFSGFLREEYGVGGHSADFPDGGRGFTDYSSKGLIIREWKTNHEEKHSWQEVAKEVKRLILSGNYLTEKEYARVTEICRANGGPAPMPKPRIRIEVGA